MSMHARQLALESGGGAVTDVNAVKAQGWTPVFVADGVEYTPDVLKRYPEAAALLRRAMAEQGLEVPESTQPGRGALQRARDR